jgi:hypothetical protein
MEFTDITLPAESADGYYLTKSKKQVDNFIYIEEEWYNQIFRPNTYYILGSKGCGKTLYAAYMCADVRNNTVSKSYTIDVGDYGKLIAMKTSNHLGFTDYLTMWKVILLQKMLLGLDAAEISFLGRSKNFKAIQETISSYFGYDVSDDSFNPINVIDSCSKQSEVASYLNSEIGSSTLPVAKTGAKSGVSSKSAEMSEKKIEQVGLVYIDTWLRAIDAFRKTIANISFRYNHFLFVDGLDVRPKAIDPEEYSECIGALVRAVYDINTKILGNMERKDKHEFRVIALTRTDIFLNSNLVNVTSCINDNCVELDWSYSNEKEFHYSNLYRMMNRVLGWDWGNSVLPAEIYFGFNLHPSKRRRPVRADMYIQRQSRLRPRDIVVLLRLIQDECKRKNIKAPNPSILESSELISKYSNYYTDQVKSEMMFNYSAEEIKSIFNLIKVLRTDSFSEEEFKKIYEGHCENDKLFAPIFENHRQMLDVLYSLDLVGWIEFSRSYSSVHWHYREVKAIDETYRLPWEQFDSARKRKLIIHKGASKHILGVAK